MDVGALLLAVGRIHEAIEATRSGLMQLSQMGAWPNAAQAAENLSEMHLALGDVSAAVREGEHALEIADRSENANKRNDTRANLAHSLCLAGASRKSALGFRDAEVMQRQSEPQHQFLYSVRGFHCCEQLLDEIPVWSLDTLTANERVLALQTINEVRNRVATTSKINSEFVGMGTAVHDVGLDYLTIGRAQICEVAICRSEVDKTALVTLLQDTERNFDEGLRSIRHSGEQEFLAVALLNHASLWRVACEVCHESNAPDRDKRIAYHKELFEKDMSESELISKRSSMLICQIEVAIERCRLCLAIGDCGSAKEHLLLAKQLVRQTEKPYEPHIPDWPDWKPPDYVNVFKAGEIVGYHRRNPEIEALERELE
jgi:hypothetical protein